MLTLLTPEDGKLRAIAKGVRRPRSRHRRQRRAVRGARPRARPRPHVRRHHPGERRRTPGCALRDTLESTATAWYLGELAERAVEERAGAHPVYALLRRAYQLLDDGMAPGRVARWFEFGPGRRAGRAARARALRGVRSRARGATTRSAGCRPSAASSARAIPRRPPRSRRLSLARSSCCRPTGAWTSRPSPRCACRPRSRPRSRPRCAASCASCSSARPLAGVRRRGARRREPTRRAVLRQSRPADRLCHRRRPRETPSMTRPETGAPSDVRSVEADPSLPWRPGPAVADLDTIVSLVEAPRLHLPLLGDLRRHQRGLGLRAARRGAQEQRQARLVAGHGPGARRHRGPGRGHPHAPPGLGDLRARGLLLATRSSSAAPAIAASGSTSCPAPSRSAPATCATRASSSGSASLPGGRADRSRRRDASTSCSRRTWARSRRTPRSSTCGPRRPRARTSTSGTSSSRAARSCPSASPRSASPSATRSARQLRVPDARVRADGDAVLRGARRAGRGGLRGVAARPAAPGTSATA